MRTRLWPAVWVVSAGSVTAAPVRNVNTLEYEYRDQQLSSRNPKVKRPDHLNILSVRSLFLYEQSKFNAQAEIGLSSGNSGTTSFTTLEARSAATWKDARSSDTLEAGWIRSHGADSTQRPLEETVLEEGAPFTGTRAGYRHQHELSAFDSVNVGAGIARNIDGTTDVESRQVTAGWARLLDKNWTNTLGLTRGTQKVKDGIASNTWELRNDDLWVLNNAWSTQTSLGGLQQAVETEKKTTFVAGAAIAYTLRISSEAGTKDKAQAIDQDMIRRPDLDRIDNIRTQSQFRAGWDRNLDQRRKGDSQFLADQFFIQGLWAVDPDQNLQLDLQRSQSIDKNVPGTSGLTRDLANLDYRWNMTVGPTVAGYLGSFGLGITQETVRQNPQRYDRQLLRVSYSVSF